MYERANRVVHTIYDNANRKYILQVYIDRELLVGNLMDQDDKIGEIKCVFQPNGDMLLGDLIIYNQVIPCSKNLATSLWRIFFKPKPINYRQRGLGTQLLQFVINEAQKHGVRKIYGSLVQEDINSNPNLANWYKKHGFQIEDPFDESLPDAVAGISLFLS